jgi:hypothetical protein
MAAVSPHVESRCGWRRRPVLPAQAYASSVAQAITQGGGSAAQAYGAAFAQASQPRAAATECRRPFPYSYPHHATLPVLRRGGSRAFLHSPPAAALLGVCRDPARPAHGFQAAAAGGQAADGLVQATAVALCQGGASATAFSEAYSVAISKSPEGCGQG